jgi:hypothetical protein
MVQDIMNRFKIPTKYWILIIVALLIILALSAQPCLAGIMWSG